MALVTAIIDGTGSLGAAVGPLLAGLLSTGQNWDNVFYMLIAADIVAALLLLRQVAKECRTSACCRGTAGELQINDGDLGGEVEREALLKDDA